MPQNLIFSQCQMQGVYGRRTLVLALAYREQSLCIFSHCFFVSPLRNQLREESLTSLLVRILIESGQLYIISFNCLYECPASKIVSIRVEYLIYEVWEETKSPRYWYYGICTILHLRKFLELIYIYIFLRESHNLLFFEVVLYLLIQISS